MKVHMGIAGQKSVAASFRPLHQWGVHAWASDSILDAKLVRGQFTLQTAQYALEQAETVRFATKSPQQSPPSRPRLPKSPAHGSWAETSRELDGMTVQARAGAELTWANI